MFIWKENGLIKDNGSVANVGAILGLARGYMILKATPKAKAQLKRVMNHPWTLEDADYLEQCESYYLVDYLKCNPFRIGWLLLADTYINQSKSDQATNILRKILQHNAVRIVIFKIESMLVFIVFVELHQSVRIYGIFTRKGAEMA